MGERVCEFKPINDLTKTMMWVVLSLRAWRVVMRGDEWVNQRTKGKGTKEKIEREREREREKVCE